MQGHDGGASRVVSMFLLIEGVEMEMTEFMRACIWKGGCSITVLFLRLCCIDSVLFGSSPAIVFPGGPEVCRICLR